MSKEYKGICKDCRWCFHRIEISDWCKLLNIPTKEKETCKGWQTDKYGKVREGVKMKIFHKHNWVKIKETYAQPLMLKQIGRCVDIHDYGLAQGLTTIIWECSICKKIRKEEMLGI